MLPPREREEVLRERVPLLRGLAAPPEPDFAADDFRAVEPPVEDLAREDVDFFAVLRFVVELFADDLRPPLPRDELLPREAEPPELEPELALALPSMVHLPDMTRCAASATASAMSEPSLVALDITLLAACVAVSAASRPASRIALRAFGLALIAAAAAARPAASISLLIAALASLSTVLSLPREDEPEELFPEDLLRAALAIAPSPLFGEKTLMGRNGSQMNREDRHGAENVKGTAASRSDALRHGQRPEVTAVRQRLELTNTPFRPPC